jgi:hypothetical protein
MVNHRRHPDPPFTPPTDAENELGYWFFCDGCQRTWSQRYIDQRTRRCLPCARAWRRDDMMSRRRGLGGVPLNAQPQPHMFMSKTLKREINLNSEEGRRLIEKNHGVRAEVDEYISAIVAKNSTPRPPLHGVVPLLPRQAQRAKAERTVVAADDEVAPVSPNAVRSVDKIVDGVMDTIDGEVVD